MKHHDSVKITEAKVRAAYDILGRPVVVNDSSWEIPALGGFPKVIPMNISIGMTSHHGMRDRKTTKEKNNANI